MKYATRNTIREKQGGGGLCHVLSDVYDVSLKSTPSAFFRKLHLLKVL